MLERRALNCFCFYIGAAAKMWQYLLMTMSMDKPVGSNDWGPQGPTEK